MTSVLAAALAIGLGVLAIGTSGASEREPGAALGLPPPAAFPGIPASPQLAALGRRLFFDARLSANGKVSCASCHQPDQAFADGRRTAVGVEERRGTRNTPSLLNAAFQSSQFWEGRRGSLEEQVLDPLVSPVEHGLPDKAALLDLIRADASYVREFGLEVQARHVARALAAFVRSLALGGSAFDRHLYGGERAALSDSAARGLDLFRGRARCTDCHTIGERDASFSDGRFHAVGIGLDRIAPKLAALAARVVRMPQTEVDALVALDGEVAALGRFLVTRDPADIGKFRTPSLRNVALTAPYMHDGSVATLEEALDHELYYRGRLQGRPLVLTPAEKRDLIAFLRSLTSLSLGRSADD
jgi:cytochrome c peroxidase